MKLEETLTVVEEVESTNEVLFRASESDYPIPSALMARRQTDGRGRADRTWASEVGGMYLSVLLKPKVVEGLALLGSYTVVRLIQERFGIESQVRWPNDVTIEGKKVAGILPQVKFVGQELERAVLGVGLNVAQPVKSFPEEIQNDVITLGLLSSKPLPPTTRLARLFLKILEEELDRLETSGLQSYVHSVEEVLEGVGHTAVLVSDSGETDEFGVVAGLGPRGELRAEDGTLLDSLSRDERLRVR